MSLDSTDIRIIEQLLLNGRASLREIAEELELSPSTVSNRFSKLRDSGIIERFQPVLDYEKMGFGFTAVVQVTVEAGYHDEVARKLSREGFVTSLFQVTGETDIISVCRFRDREEMRENLIEGLNKMEGILDTNTNVVLDSHENRGIDLAPLDDEEQ